MRAGVCNDLRWRGSEVKFSRWGNGFAELALYVGCLLGFDTRETFPHWTERGVEGRVLVKSCVGEALKLSLVDGGKVLRTLFLYLGFAQ